MADIATLGIAVDATPVSKASTELDKLTAAGERASASTSKVGGEIARQSSAMQQTVSATNQASQAVDRNTKAFRDLDAELEKYLAANNRAYAAQRNFQQGQDLLARGVESGLISQKTASDTLADLEKKLASVGDTQGKTTVSTGYLTREIRALGDELSSGRYRQADGTFVNLATRITGMGGAALGAVGAVVAIGAAIAVIIAKGEEAARAIKNIETGFAATGNAGLLSDQQVKAYIDDLSRLPGVSKDAAEATLSELSRVPYVTGPLFDQSTKIVRDFATLLGVDTPKAAAVLAKAFDDPKRGADELDKQFNILSADQRLAIQGYSEHGDRAAALAVLLQALEDRVRGLTDNGLTPMQKAANDVAKAWDDTVRSFSNTGPINVAGDSVAKLLEKVAGFVGYIGQHSGQISSFFGEFASFAKAQASLLVNPIGTIGAMFKRPTGQGVSGPLDDSANYRPSQNYGDGIGSATGTTSGQSEAQRAALDAGQKYIDRSDKAKDLLELEGKIKDVIKQQNDELKNGNLTEDQRKTITAARATALTEVAGIEQRIQQLQKQRGPVTPLGLNVDHSELEAGLKAVQVQQDAIKAALAEGQKYRDFYHKAGITSDADYNRATDAANADYLAQQQRFYEQQIALVTADEAKLKALKPANKAQADQITTAVNNDEKQRIELLSKEDALTKQIAADSAFRAATAPILKAQEDFNAALKQTQEISTQLGEAEQRANLDVQIGLKSQTEATQDVIAARTTAIAQLTEYRDKLTAALQAEGLATDSAKYIEQAKAIDQVNLKLLQLKSELDPIGKALNQTFNQDLVSFFDKFGSGGIKTFKDLKTAALDFVGSLSSAIAHQANQALADSILKSLGAQANSATGTTGGLGGAVASLLGLGGSTVAKATATSQASGAIAGLPNPTSAASTATDDPLGDFIKKLGTSSSSLDSLTKGGDSATKSVIGLVSKQATAETAQASATAALEAFTQALYNATGALSGNGAASGATGGSGSAGGLFGGLFGGGASGGSTATASQVAQADAMDSAAASFSADGVVPFLHGGGIVGRDAAFSRFLALTQKDVDAAPRMHGGGIAGLAGYEQLTVLKKGEEVLTDDDPRHRNNASSRRQRPMNVVQNFTVQPTESRSSQQQVAARAYNGLRAAAMR